MSRKHALLSPSSGKRWMVCTPSARLGEGISSSSSYADEGTLAHEIFEVLLKDRFGLIKQHEYAARLIELQRSEYYTKAMLNHCYEAATYVETKYNEYLAKGLKPQLFIEVGIDYSYYVPEGTGYLDVAILAGIYLFIFDFKYGQGVKVEVEDNEQLKMYALGMYEKVIFGHDIEEIELCIFQPRLSNISCWSLSSDELIAWAKNVLKPAAELAWKGEGDLITGDHCKFCPVLAICPALTNLALSVAAERFADGFEQQKPELLDDDAINDILAKVDLIKDWVTAVKEYALQEALKGKKWKGYKLVRGRSNRKYTDEEKILELLTNDHFFEEEQITRKSLLPITEMEVFLGEKLFKKILSEYVVKPKGAPTLVINTDKRPEIKEEAQAVFDDFDEFD